MPPLPPSPPLLVTYHVPSPSWQKETKYFRPDNQDTSFFSIYQKGTEWVGVIHITAYIKMAVCFYFIILIKFHLFIQIGGNLVVLFLTFLYRMVGD